MLLLCARLYSELGLPLAAKQYALAAAAAAKTAPAPELNRYVPRGIILAAQYDRQAGNWISATRLFSIGLMAQNVYCDEPYNHERYPYVWEMMADQALTLRVADAVRPGFVPLLRTITASVGIDTLIDDLLAPTADDPTVTEETYAEEADAQGIGRPFSDATLHATTLGTRSASTGRSPARTNTSRCWPRNATPRHSRYSSANSPHRNRCSCPDASASRSA